MYTQVPDEFIRESVVRFRAKRDYVLARLRAIPHVTCPTPEGAFYAFPNIKETGFKAKELEEKLLHEAGVAVLAGTSFGHLGEGYLRFSYASSVEEIRAAAKRVRELLS